jgi:hypothetical protein
VICYRGRDQAKAFNEHHDVAVMRAVPRVGQRSIKLAHDALDDRPHFERLGSRLRGRADQVRHPLLDARIARHAPLVVRAKHSVGQRVDATDGVAQVFELVLERPLRAPLCLRAAGPDIVRNSDLSGRNRTSVLRPTGAAHFEEGDPEAKER